MAVLDAGCSGSPGLGRLGPKLFQLGGKGKGIQSCCAKWLQRGNAVRRQSKKRLWQRAQRRGQGARCVETAVLSRGSSQSFNNLFLNPMVCHICRSSWQITSLHCSEISHLWWLLDF